MKKLTNFILLIALCGLSLCLNAQIPINGLIAYYPFTGNAADLSGNNYNGIVNGATLTQDRFGNTDQAFNFNGVSDFIEILDALPLRLSNTDFTISIWFNYSSSINNNSLLSKRTDQFQNGWCIGINGGTVPTDSVGYVTYSQSGGNDPKISTQSIVLNNSWQNVVIQYTLLSQTMRLYRNGIIENTKFNFPTPNPNTNANLLIGNNNNQPYFMSGKIDDIRIYNRALNNQEIQTLYQEGQLSASVIMVDAPATVKQNDTVEVSINTSVLQSADGIISYQFKLGYDVTRLTYLSNSLTGTLDNGGVLNINSSTSGLLNIGYMTSTALSGQGSLVKVKFIATQTLGDANFILSDFVYNTTAITDLVNDMVTVIDGIPPTGAVTYSIPTGICREGDAFQITVTFDESIADSPIPQLNFTGANTLANTNMTKVNSTVYTYDYVVQHGTGNVNVNLATGTDLAGNIVVANPTSGTYFTILPTVYGDIDTNDIVQAYDAALALQYSVGIDPLPTSDPLPWSNWRKIVGNVDATGDITANDAALILQYSIGLITTFPVGSKSIQENPIADITITQENNEILFTSTGELYGLNIYSSNGTSVTMGNPNVLDPNMLNVTNINSSVYNIGLCTAYSPVENSNIMRIPFTCTVAESITFNMIINKNSVAKSINLNPVGIPENKIQSVNIFPNPANDKIIITGLNNGTIEIINTQGQIVKTSNLTNSKTTVDLTKISGGVYTIKIKSDNGIIVKQMIKQ